MSHARVYVVVSRLVTRTPPSENILDSGPYSRVYACLMASIQNGVQPTLQIGELAKRTALSIDAIRFYERRKLLPPAFRSAGRFRLYTTDDI